MIQVLIDADNLPVHHLEGLLRALPLDEVALVVAGSGEALGMVEWPPPAMVHHVVGPQEADAALLAAYRPGAAPLVVASGDKDFAGIVRGHGGPVLVVADRPAKALQAVAEVIDPVRDGIDAVRRWFDDRLDAPWRDLGPAG